MLTQQEFVMRWLSGVRAAIAAHAHEEGGNNRGPQIEAYQRACGGEPGESWCLYMQVFYALKTMAAECLLPGQQMNAANIVGLCRAQWPTVTRCCHLPVTGSCGAACDYFDRRGMLRRQGEIKEIKLGWLIFYAWAEDDINSGIPRHVGMCDADWQPGSGPILSLEGNTADASGNPADGDGCFRKERAFANVVAVARTY